MLVPSTSRSSTAIHLCGILNDSGLQTLGVLDVHSLHVAVELLLRALLVVTLSRYPDSQAERHTADSRLPHLLVQLGVEADVGGSL